MILNGTILLDKKYIPYMLGIHATTGHIVNDVIYVQYIYLSVVNDNI